VKYLVFSSPAPGQDAAYNDWYDNVHLKDLLDIPGVTGATRYRLQRTDSGPGSPAHDYLAIYELDGEPGEVMAQLMARASDGRIHISDALDVGSVVQGLYEQI